MQVKDVEVRHEVMEATIKASELTRSIGESLYKAGRFKESGQWVEHVYGTPLEWPVHRLLKLRVENCITEVRRTVTVAWEHPTEFTVRMLKTALIDLEADGRTLAHADALRSVVGEQEAKRLIELELTR